MITQRSDTRQNLEDFLSQDFKEIGEKRAHNILTLLIEKIGLDIMNLAEIKKNAKERLTQELTKQSINATDQEYIMNL